jgi:hypothetical protein
LKELWLGCLFGSWGVLVFGRREEMEMTNAWNETEIIGGSECWSLDLYGFRGQWKLLGKTNAAIHNTKLWHFNRNSLSLSCKRPAAHKDMTLSARLCGTHQFDKLNDIKIALMWHNQRFPICIASCLLRWAIDKSKILLTVNLA